MLDIAPVGSERSVEGMEYTVAGHTIRFPHAAYGVQLSFMGKALQTLASRSNALLEAPTGSGKTLSLLCSSLAWQEAVKLQRQAVPQCKYGLSFVVQPCFCTADGERGELVPSHAKQIYESVQLMHFVCLLGPSIRAFRQHSCIGFTEKQDQLLHLGRKSVSSSSS